MSTTAEIRFPITGGDSKFELLAQLADIGRVNHRPTFKLTLHHPRLRSAITKCTVFVFIDGVEAEDGSGNSWIITGRLHMGLPHWLTEEIGDKRSFKGYYHSRVRSGSITIL